MSALTREKRNYHINGCFHISRDCPKKYVSFQKTVSFCQPVLDLFFALMKTISGNQLTNQLGVNNISKCTVYSLVIDSKAGQ